MHRILEQVHNTLGQMTPDDTKTLAHLVMSELTIEAMGEVLCDLIGGDECAIDEITTKLENT